MHKNLYAVPEDFAAAAQVRRADYERMYAESVEDPDRFWGRIGRRLEGRDTLIGSNPRTLQKRHGVRLHKRAVGASGRTVRLSDGRVVADDHRDGKGSA